MEEYTLTLIGEVPSKKNLNRHAIMWRGSKKSVIERLETMMVWLSQTAPMDPDQAAKIRRTLEWMREELETKLFKPFVNTYRDDDVQAKIQALVNQVRAQWLGRPALVHPEVTVRFQFPRFSKDQDNAYTTIMDVLQEAGVLRNDSAAHNNGWKHIAPVNRGEPKTWIVLRASGQLDLMGSMGGGDGVMGSDPIVHLNHQHAEEDRLQRANAALRDALEYCAETTELVLGANLCPTESSSPNSDNAVGGLGALRDARAALTNTASAAAAYEARIREPLEKRIAEVEAERSALLRQIACLERDVRQLEYLRPKSVGDDDEMQD